MLSVWARLCAVVLIIFTPHFILSQSKYEGKQGAKIPNILEERVHTISGNCICRLQNCCKMNWDFRERTWFYLEQIKPKRFNSNKFLTVSRVSVPSESGPEISGLLSGYLSDMKLFSFPGNTIKCLPPTGQTVISLIAL